VWSRELTSAAEADFCAPLMARLKSCPSRSSRALALTHVVPSRAESAAPPKSGVSEIRISVGRLLAHQVHNGFEMVGLGEEIDEVHLLDTIACGLQRHEIAGQGCRITGDISDARRVYARQRTRHAIA
jgi:hypothetical protein